LIEARIAARRTQRELADWWVCRSSRCNAGRRRANAGVAIERLQEIADALQVRVLETVIYAVPG
jgi:hypothetical protein